MAKVKIEIGGTDPGVSYDQLLVSGFTVVAGTLEIKLIDAFTPTADDSFEVIDYSSHDSGFVEIDGLDIGNGNYFTAESLTEGFILSVCNGDAGFSLLQGSVIVDSTYQCQTVEDTILIASDGICALDWEMVFEQTSPDTSTWGYWLSFEPSETSATPWSMDVTQPPSEDFSNSHHGRWRDTARHLLRSD